MEISLGYESDIVKQGVQASKVLDFVGTKTISSAMV